MTPRTSILGAMMLTGYLGGAVASNVRVGTGWFTTLFPLVFAIFVWGGIWLRDFRLREMLPFRVNFPTTPAHIGPSSVITFKRVGLDEQNSSQRFARSL